MKRKTNFNVIISIILIELLVFIECQKSVTLQLNKEHLNGIAHAGRPITNYYLNVNVGTPGKPYKMLFDIDSSETWIPHSLTFSVIFKRLHYNIGYSKKESSTSVKENQEYSIDYQGCILTGKAYEDHFKFENNLITENNNLSIRQRFLAISSASNGLLGDYASDGVIGISPATLSELGSRSVLVGLHENRLIDDLKFSLYLDANLNSSYGGEVTFGSINSSNYFTIHESIQLHNLTNLHNKWALNLNNVMLGGQVIPCNQLECMAILSTGVNEIYGPLEDVLNIMTSLNVSTFNRPMDDQIYYYNHEIDCLKIVNLPPITFNIDGILYSVPPEMYLKKNEDGLFTKTTTCYVAIFPHKLANNQWILGTNYLSNYYTVFDFNKRQVGFASKKSTIKNK